MGVYIEGMKMPQNCFLCPLSTLNAERLFCEVTKDEVVRAKRSSDCPLVPVPQHGRLIDADALLAQHYGRFGVIDEVAREAIKNAPTIIPAEEGET